MSNQMYINIYKGLPLFLEEVKATALAREIGKSSVWITQKSHHSIVKGRALEFYAHDVDLVNEGLKRIGAWIANHLIDIDATREEQIAQIREVGTKVCLPYIYTNVMNKDKRWFEGRMYTRPTGKNITFKPDEILAINRGLLQISADLSGISLTL